MGKGNKKKQKTVYLVRHAKSSWSDLSLDDIDRPLKKRGRRNGPEMGKRIAAYPDQPELILSSPARRAMETAQLIAGEINYSDSDIEICDALYFASHRNVLAAIHKLDNSYNNVMLIGHNPVLFEFMHELCENDQETMPTCAVAVIKFDIDSWKRLKPGSGVLAEFDYPKKK